MRGVALEGISGIRREATTKQVGVCGRALRVVAGAPLAPVACDGPLRPLDVPPVRLRACACPSQATGRGTHRRPLTHHYKCVRPLVPLVTDGNEWRLWRCPPFLTSHGLRRPIRPSSQRTPASVWATFNSGRDTQRSRPALRRGAPHGDPWRESRLLGHAASRSSFCVVVVGPADKRLVGVGRSGELKELP